MSEVTWVSGAHFHFKLGFVLLCFRKAGQGNFEWALETWFSPRLTSGLESTVKLGTPGGQLVMAPSYREISNVSALAGF